MHRKEILQDYIDIFAVENVHGRVTAMYYDIIRVLNFRGGSACMPNAVLNLHTVE